MAGCLWTEWTKWTEKARLKALLPYHRLYILDGSYPLFANVEIGVPRKHVSTLESTHKTQNISGLSGERFFVPTGRWPLFSCTGRINQDKDRKNSKNAALYARKARLLAGEPMKPINSHKIWTKNRGLDRGIKNCNPSYP